MLLLRLAHQQVRRAAFSSTKSFGLPLAFKRLQLRDFLWKHLIINKCRSVIIHALVTKILEVLVAQRNNRKSELPEMVGKPILCSLEVTYNERVIEGHSYINQTNGS